MFTGKIHDCLHRKEVPRELLTLDDSKFILNSLDVLWFIIESPPNKSFLANINQCLVLCHSFRNHVGRKLHLFVGMNVSNLVMNNVVGPLDSLTNYIIIIKFHLSCGLKVRIPNLRRVLRIQLTLKIVFRFWKKIGIKVLIVQPSKLLVDLAFLPVVWTRIMRIASNNQSILKRISLCELDDSTIHEVLRRQFVKLQF